MQKADEPLKKVTLNLFQKDVDNLYRLFGWGWSEVVRKWVRQNLKAREENEQNDKRVDGS